MYIKIKKDATLTLPHEICKQLHLHEGDLLKSTIQSDTLLLQKTNLHSSLFTINCFGHFQFYFSNQILAIHSKKGQELLALLTCEKGNFLTKRNIAQLLWSDTSLKKAMDNLYKVYAQLKKFFSKHNIPFPIISVNRQMRLDFSFIKCDFILFEELYTRKEHIDDLLKAIDLYKGPLLFDECYSWSTTLEAHYEIRYIELIEHTYHYYFKKNNQKKTSYYKKLLEQYY